VLTFTQPRWTWRVLGLGVLATGVGLGFVRVLYTGEDISDGI